MSKADNKKMEYIKNKLYEIQDNIDWDNEENLERRNIIHEAIYNLENSISKETLIDKIRERQFELQQEYKDFKDDVKLNTLQDLLEEIEK